MMCRRGIRQERAPWGIMGIFLGLGWAVGGCLGRFEWLFARGGGWREGKGDLWGWFVYSRRVGNGDRERERDGVGGFWD